LSPLQAASPKPTQTGIQQQDGKPIRAPIGALEVSLASIS
jgi:hypothetical protein